MSEKREETDAASDGSRRLAGLQRSAFEPSLATALEENLPILRRRMLALVGTEEAFVKRLGKELDEILADLGRGLERPDTEHIRNERLDEIHRRVAEAASCLGVTPLDDVVIGTLHKRSIDAFSNSFFGAANIIAVHAPLMVFAYLIAKAAATFPLAHSPFDDEGRDRPSIPVAYYQLGLRWLTQLVHATVIDRDPIGAPSYVPPRNWPFWHLALAWLDGIEFFCVAHEYGHLLHDQGSMEQLRAADLLLEGEVIEDPITSELAADRFGFAAVWQGCAPDGGVRLGAFGPLVFLWFLAQLETVGHVMHGEGHPSATLRLARAEEMFPSADEAAVWAVMKKRLNGAWSISARAAGVTRE